jgi:hypothetical protein
MGRTLLAAALLAATAQDFKSFKGKTPPPLTAPDNGWINAKKPLKLDELKGRVVWLEFSFVH